jgi:uncharacterized membrane protein YfcA
MNQSATLASASFVIGILTGLTGVGGGAILTPALILFGVPPLAAVSNDLVASLAIKPFGAVVHGRRKTVELPLLLWLCAGSVPAAFSGALLLAVIPSAGQVNMVVKLLVGGTMALTAGLMLLRLHVSQTAQVGGEEPFHVRPALTVTLGAAAGLLVGLTSIGSGSVIAAGLLLLYPRLATARVVGTDVAHAIPLVASATLGHLLFGQVHLALALALIAGGIPGVVIGSYLASRVPNTALRGGLVVLLVATSATLLGASVPLIVAATAVAAVVTVTLVAVRSQASDRLGVRVTADEQRHGRLRQDSHPGPLSRISSSERGRGR